jgi:hypothetical protein
MTAHGKEDTPVANHRRLLLSPLLGVLLAFFAPGAWATCNSGTLNAGGIYCTVPLSASSYTTLGSSDVVVKWSVWFTSDTGTCVPDTRLDHSSTTLYQPPSFSGTGCYQTCLNNNTSGVTASFTVCN